MLELIFYEKHKTIERDVIEGIVWKINKTKDFPNGVKYRLVYIHKGIRILGYDNERAKGDHKHYFDRECLYEFVSPEKLKQDFLFDIMKIRRGLYGNKEN